MSGRFIKTLVFPKERVPFQYIRRQMKVIVFFQTDISKKRILFYFKNM